MDQIVTIHKNEPRTSSWVLKDGFEVEHRAITKLVKKYKTEFEEFGIITSGMQKLKGAGRPAKTFLLNENQTYFLGTLLPNTETVRRFKLTLVKNFDIAKKALYRMMAQKSNPELTAQRVAGKIVHREKTDTIKEFIEYAITQGGSVKGCKRYYSNIATMENKALFLLEQKFKNLRDILDLNQLATITSADGIARKAIKEGMQSNLHYKDIYQLAKKRVETFAELHGKTFIPASQEAKRLEA